MGESVRTVRLARLGRAAKAAATAAEAAREVRNREIALADSENMPVREIARHVELSPSAVLSILASLAAR